MTFDLEATVCGGSKVKVSFTVNLECFTKVQQLLPRVKCEDCSKPFGTRTYGKTIQTVYQNSLSLQCEDFYPEELCTDLATPSTASCFDKFSYTWCLNFLTYQAKHEPSASSENAFKMVIPSLVSTSPSHIVNWPFQFNMWLSEATQPGCYAQNF